MRAASALLVIGLLAYAARAHAAEDPAAPPEGLQPARTSLSSVLAAYRRARGSSHATTSTQRWSISFGGVAGTRTLIERGNDFRLDETRGGYHTAYGSYRNVDWHMDENGLVVRESGLHKRDDVSAQAIGMAQRGSSKDVTLIGRVEQPVRATVVRVAPAGGRLEYLFFDERTGLLDRIERVRDGRRESVVYTDYRAAGGLTRSYHVTIDDGRANNVRDEVIVAYDTGTTIADDALAIPHDDHDVTTLGGLASVALPARILADRVILPFVVGAHTVDFQLDSGASGIAVDRSVVQALHLPETGRVTGETAGEYTESTVTFERMSVGSLALSKVVARALPFRNMADDKTPVAGLMGFDFFASQIVHIDYQHGTVELLDRTHFTPPANAANLHVELDDDVPVVTASIAGASNLHFMLDTGADRSLLFTAFAQAHPREVADQGLGTAMRGSFPFLGSLAGVGGDVSYQPVQVAQFTVGNWTFPRWLFYLTKDAPAFEGEDYDGLIGQDVLRYFDVYFDYKAQRVYFAPNDRYRDRWS